ncbi:hypothetical protein BOW53_00640 [Solemya pervernicosa gill symbiont]|uniref:histidine kinase n=1 Tax=Solemya pervernicosa gill symbiont TaxID=642797 RepID=A0A1T2LAK3_9GAMM|nr:ATP-binding protein [Solemya pervernicosa gill symbiont]OOZ42121.1 hypothetical protein BOW53_00640 [Solemya pervernicosa gill symbiont]
MPGQHSELLQRSHPPLGNLEGVVTEIPADRGSLERRIAKLTRELALARRGHQQQMAEKTHQLNRLEEIIEALPGGVVVLDGIGNIRAYNPIVAEMFGQPLQGIAWQEVLARKQLPDQSEQEGVALQGGRRVVVSVRQLTSEPGVILLLHDVTESHQLEQTANRQQRLAAMGEMSASMAHQIRTPLASALLYTSHLKRPALKEDGRIRIADKIRARMIEMERMVNDMLRFARGGDSTVINEIDLNALLDALQQTLDPQLEQSGAQLHIERCEQAVTFSGNYEAILGMLLNLATNALQVATSTPVLDVGLTVSERSIRFSVADNGPGIAAEQQARIFDPFYTTRADGTGLGLAVARSVVEAHHGEIRVDSKPGEGACFTITLPRSAAPQMLASSSDLAGLRETVEQGAFPPGFDSGEVRS